MLLNSFKKRQIKKKLTLTYPAIVLSASLLAWVGTLAESTAPPLEGSDGPAETELVCSQQNEGFDVSDQTLACEIDG